VSRGYWLLKGFILWEPGRTARGGGGALELESEGFAGCIGYDATLATIPPVKKN